MVQNCRKWSNYKNEQWRNNFTTAEVKTGLEKKLFQPESGQNLELTRARDQRKYERKGLQVRHQARHQPGSPRHGIIDDTGCDTELHR